QEGHRLGFADSLLRVPALPVGKRPANGCRNQQYPRSNGRRSRSIYRRISPFTNGSHSGKLALAWHFLTPLTYWACSEYGQICDQSSMVSFNALLSHHSPLWFSEVPVEATCRFQPDS